METYIELKQLEENPHYQVQKQKSLCNLTDDMIDMPIIDIINGFNKLLYFMPEIKRVHLKSE